MTLWGRAAEEQGAQLEALPHPLVSLSQCRVTDYNGAHPALRSQKELNGSAVIHSLQGCWREPAKAQAGMLPCLHAAPSSPANSDDMPGIGIVRLALIYQPTLSSEKVC